MATCSRNGCTKTLRIDNSSGACSSNCQSPDAPPSQRARVTNPREAAPPKKHEVLEASPDEVMVRFTQVATGLGKDPNAILAEAAQGWLDSVAELINAADRE
jgi:hypothetical protein